MTSEPKTAESSSDGELDADELKKFGFRVWSYRMGEVVATTIHLGDRLGLYGAMQNAGPVTAEELAQTTDLHARFVHEWLMGQAAARLIDRHDDGRFELSPVQAALLADEHGSVHFAAGSFQGGHSPELIDRMVESFRTGQGITYEDQGPAAAAGLARMTAPRSRHHLTSTVIPSIDGLADALESGTKVIEIGCGGGVALRVLAETYPNSTFIGVDPSAAALEIARAQAESDGLTNITFVEGFAADLEADGDAGLVIAFDCLHDMPRPDEATAAAHGALADDGVLLVKEIRSSGDFQRDARNPLLAMFYGFSITSCLQSAMSEPDGMGLGTLGLHPEAIAALTAEAGFTTCQMHDLEDPANLYYEIRK